MNGAAGHPQVTVTLQASAGELSSLGLRDLLGIAEAHPWRAATVAGTWILVLILSVVTGLQVEANDWTAIPLQMGGFQVYVTPYPPLFFCTLLLFWMGFLWAFIPAYLATLFLSLHAGMAFGWAVLFAFSDIVGLAFLAIAYRSTGMGFNLRSWPSIGFFLGTSFVAALAGASGSFIWSHTRDLSAVETFAVWEGWWLGAFLQTALFCGPLLFFLTPAVARLKVRWFGPAVHHRRGPMLLTIAVALSVFLVSAFLLGISQLSRLRLANQVAEGYSANQLLEFADAALLHLSLVGVLLIFACGLGFLGLTMRWNRELAREVRVRTRILEQGRKRIRQIINLIPHVIFARDEAGDFVFANRATSRILGHSANELASSDKYQSLRNNPQLRLFGDKEQAVFGGEEQDTEEIEILTNAAGEERKMRTSRLLLGSSEAQRAAVVTVAVDVTDQEQTEERLNSLVAELAVKNRELESFTYTVSHDLKSPLITIRGFAREMARQLEAGHVEDLQDDLERIQKASQRMHKLLDGLLVLSRSGRLSGPKQQVDMNALVGEVVEIMRGQVLEAGAEIEVAPELPPAHGDPVRLYELMQNLVENAIKFVRPDVKARVRIGCDEFESETRYFVADNGVGIDPDDRERVFGLFEQLGSNSDGTGIGLALARRILEVHGGRIWIESDPETGGTRFVFVLPRAAEAGRGETRS